MTGETDLEIHDLFSRVTGDKKKSGLIRKYGLNMSRQAFREKAEAIGFKKVWFFFFFSYVTSHFRDFVSSYSTRCIRS